MVTIMAEKEIHSTNIISKTSVYKVLIRLSDKCPFGMV